MEANKLNYLTSAICALLLFYQSTCAQNGPFSNRTINASSTDIIAPKGLELQITPTVSWSKREFDQDSKNIKSESGTLESGLSIQMNSGITQKLEWGLMYSVDVSEVGLGLKYKFAQIKNQLHFAVGAWSNIPTASQNDLKSGDKNPDHVAKAGISLITEYHLTKRMHFYFDVLGRKFYSDVEPAHELDFLFNLDADYKITDGVMAIAGFSFQQISYNNSDNDSQLGTVGYGVIFAHNESWNMCVFHNLDVFGKRNIASNSITAILTVVF